MKTFKDLKFKLDIWTSTIIAVEAFENGYGVSIVKSCENTYEGLVLFGNNIVPYIPNFGATVRIYLYEDEVSDFMIKVQSLK